MRDIASWFPWPAFMDVKCGENKRNDAWARKFRRKLNDGRKLTILESLHPLFPQDCIKFNREVAQFVKDDPDFARRPHFFVPYFQEYLLFRILCYKPPLDLVKQVFDTYPPALHEPNEYHRSALHCACQFQASTAVIQYLLEMQPEALYMDPSPLVLALHPETPPEAIELLIKAYPLALVKSYDGRYTAIDQAFNEGLAPCTLHTMIKYYPNSTLSINMCSGSHILSPEVAMAMTSGYPHIKVLNISRMRLSQDTFELLWIMMALNTTLLEFSQDVSSIETDEQSLANSMERMLSRNTHLKTLSFSNGIKSRVVGLALLKGLNRNDSLNNLCIQGGLDKSDITLLINLIARKPNISTFSLRDTKTDFANAAISSLVHLIHLDLGNCDAGPTIAKPLAALIHATTSLQVLKVAYNQIDSEGTQLIANAFAKNTSVVHVDYRGNTLGYEGWLALVQVLQDSNFTLTEFQLNYNEETVIEDYYLSLNQAHRKQASDATKEEFIALLICAPSFDMQHGLLRHVPHIWCNLND